MKLNMLALVAVTTAVATPALAAGEGDSTNPAVWIALGSAILGSLVAIFGSLLAVKAKKQKPSSDE